MSDIVTDEFAAKEYAFVFKKNDDASIDPVYFLKHYKDIMARYIADGKPSGDTARSYFSEIDKYLSWCAAVRLNPFEATEQQIIYYRGYMIGKNKKPATVKFSLTAVRRFYYVATKYGLIETNPAIDVHAQRDPNASLLPSVKYLTLERLQELLDTVQYEDEEREVRVKTIIALMALEGLRTVEVHRLNVEDIRRVGKDAARSMVILIRGKGHNDNIYPSSYTVELLERYLRIRKKPAVGPRDLTPVFTSQSNRAKDQRLSRRSIRREVDAALELIQAKRPGISCHMLRHTCGTLLYAETKDIQVVKETLRHKSIEVTSKYSHVQDALLHRYTEAIPIVKTKKKTRS